jgi:hypothetical protein
LLEGEEGLSLQIYVLTLDKQEEARELFCICFLTVFNLAILQIWEKHIPTIQLCVICPSKRNKVPRHAAIWMNLKNIVLSEINHKRSIIVLIHLYEISRIGKSIEADSRLLIAKVG